MLDAPDQTNMGHLAKSVRAATRIEGTSVLSPSYLTFEGAHLFRCPVISISKTLKNRLIVVCCGKCIQKSENTSRIPLYNQASPTKAHIKSITCKSKMNDCGCHDVNFETRICLHPLSPAAQLTTQKHAKRHKITTLNTPNTTALHQCKNTFKFSVRRLQLTSSLVFKVSHISDEDRWFTSKPYTPQSS